MPLDRREIVLSEEIKRIDDKMDELLEQVADLHPDNPAVDDLQSKGRQLDTHLSGLEWAQEEWGADATIILEGLTGGEFAKVEDELSDVAVGRQRRGGQPGARRVFLVAFGVDDAPYLDDGADDDARIAAAGALPLAFQKWAEAQINELSSVGGNERPSWSQLLKEKRREQATAPTDSS
jgi:hypothetical protein